jgi:NDP-sugar pyrophosphorylase family protein
VIHGDILTDIHLDEVFEFHLQEATHATVIVKPKLGMKQYGQVFIQGNRVTTFSETGTDSGISLINTGVYVLNREVLSLIPAKKISFLENDIFPHLARKNQLRAYFFQGLWYDISTPTQYNQAVSDWQNPT